MNIKILENYVLYMGNFILLLNVILVAITYGLKEKESSFNWLIKWAKYSLCLFLFELILIKFILSKKFYYINEIMIILNHFGIKDYSFISSISYFFKFIFLGLFFRDIFESKNLKNIFQILVILLVTFELIMIFVYKSYQGYDSVSSTIKNIFIILGSGLFLYKFYNNDSGNLKLAKNPYFWIGIGLFIPAISELFLEFIFTKLYQTDTAGFYKYYIYRNVSQIIGFLLLIKGFLQFNYLKFLPNKY